MISSLGSLVQFSPATGRAGALQTDIAVFGEHSPCSGHTGFALYRGVCAFLVYTAQAPGCSMWSGPCVECGSSFRVLQKSADSVAPAFCVFPGLSGSGSQGFVRALPRARCAFSPPRRAAQVARGLAASPGVWRAFSLRGEQPGQPGVWRPFPWRCAPFPSAAPPRAAGRVSGSL